MFRKLSSLILAVMLCFTMISAAYATSAGTSENLHNWNIIYYNEESQQNKINTANDVVVISEEQMLELRSNVKAFFEYAEMVYILTTMSVNEIQDICEMPSLLHSEDKSSEKFATAIELQDDGNYKFHNVSALYTDIATNQYAVATTDSVQNISLSNTQLIEDGLDAIFTTNSKETNATQQNNARMQASGFAATSTDSAVVYDNSGNRIGTMGYTMYWYKVVKSGSNRIFDVICVATFAPDSGYKCSNMSVYLGTSQANHEVLEAANIISNGQTYTHSLSLTASKQGVSGTGETSWSYSIDAQTVTKSFDMTTNDRTWIFKPKKAGDNDAWIEEPGIRMYSSQEKCYTKVKLSCPFVTILGIELAENTLSKNWYMAYS